MADFVDGFLSNYSEEVQAICRKLRDVSRHEMKGAQEFLYYNAINYSLSTSFLDRVCYIRPLAKRVTLGFLYGARLDDPDHLLQGIGKRSRHVRIRTVKEAEYSGLKELVKQAWKEAADSVRTMKEERRKWRALGRIRTHRRTKRMQRPHAIRRRA